MESSIAQNSLFSYLVNRTSETYFGITHSHKPVYESEWYWRCVFQDVGLPIANENRISADTNSQSILSYTDTDVAIFLRSVNLAFMCTLSGELSEAIRINTHSCPYLSMYLVSLMRNSMHVKAATVKTIEPFSDVITSLDKIEIVDRSWRYSSLIHLLSRARDGLRVKLLDLATHYVSFFPLLFVCNNLREMQSPGHTILSSFESLIPPTLSNYPLILMSQADASNSWKVECLLERTDRDLYLHDISVRHKDKPFFVFSPFPHRPLTHQSGDKSRLNSHDHHFLYLSEVASSALVQMTVSH